MADEILHSIKSKDYYELLQSQLRIIGWVAGLFGTMVAILCAYGVHKYGNLAQQASLLQYDWRTDYPGTACITIGLDPVELKWKRFEVIVETKKTNETWVSRDPQGGTSGDPSLFLEIGIYRLTISRGGYKPKVVPLTITDNEIGKRLGFNVRLEPL